MSDTHTITIPGAVGTLSVTAVGRNHVVVSADELVVNRVAHRVTGQLHTADSGATWRYADPDGSYRPPYFRREDHGQPTSSASRKLYQGIPAALSEWAGTAEGQAALAASQTMDRERIRSRGQDIARELRRLADLVEAASAGLADRGHVSMPTYPEARDVIERTRSSLHLTGVSVYRTPGQGWGLVIDGDDVPDGWTRF